MVISAERVRDTLIAGALPVLDVFTDESGPSVSFSRELTSPEIASMATIISGLADTPEAEAAFRLQKLRQQTKQALENQSSETMELMRALLIELVQEINQLRQFDQELKTAVANSTNYATLKANISALRNMPDRTFRNLMDQVKARLD